MNQKFEPLDNGEVLSVDASAQLLIGHRTFRVGEFAEALRSQLEYGLGGSSGWTEEKDGWFSENGIECEVLKFGNVGWQKGKVRIKLEFRAEEPNSTAKLTSHYPAIEDEDEDEDEDDFSKVTILEDEAELAAILSEHSEPQVAAVEIDESLTKDIWE
jgi:hypothetical protein